MTMGVHTNTIPYSFIQVHTNAFTVLCTQFRHTHVFTIVYTHTYVYAHTEVILTGVNTLLHICIAIQTRMIQTYIHTGNGDRSKYHSAQLCIHYTTRIDYSIHIYIHTHDDRNPHHSAQLYTHLHTRFNNITHTYIHTGNDDRSPHHFAQPYWQWQNYFFSHASPCANCRFAHIIIFTLIHIHICTHTHIYIYIHVYIYVYIYIHT